ncbi:AAA family ATPase [Pseudonocardia alni subsp. carboxydivorans]|uniref:AAA family ATPase n=1 Tax=Pseudonocardia alni TaxID=33907 RepID=UPI0031F726B2
MSTEPAGIRETHAGLVVLAGDRAYKVKKAVRTPYCDFGSAALRRRALARELELNRRFAPDVYLGLGSFRSPDGATAEPVLVMRRMPADRSLTAALSCAGPDERDELVRSVARAVADAHRRAPRGDPGRAGPAALAARWSANLTELGELTADRAVQDRLTPMRTLARDYLAGRTELFGLRETRVVDGHGDLLADDVYCLDDGPRLLDCLDFDDDLRQVDVLDDVATLAMDLDHHGMPGAARALVDGYRRFTGDDAPESLLHHFVAYRAVVRAKVAALRGRQGAAVAAAEVAALSALGLRGLQAGAVRLALVGGPPGSGKTTLAGALAAATGARLLSSDLIRDDLDRGRPGDGARPGSGTGGNGTGGGAVGGGTVRRGTGGYGTGRYTPERVAAVYTSLLDAAGPLLGRGESVVLDASWTTAERRLAARALAARHHAVCVELRCAVDPRTADARIAARGPSPSGADAAVAARMRAAAAPWPEAVRIDTAGGPGAASGAALSAALSAWSAGVGC